MPLCKWHVPTFNVRYLNTIRNSNDTPARNSLGILFPIDKQTKQFYVGILIRIFSSVTVLHDSIMVPDALNGTRNLQMGVSMPFIYICSNIKKSKKENMLRRITASIRIEAEILLNIFSFNQRLYIKFHFSDYRNKLIALLRTINEIPIRLQVRTT